jgi:glutamine phosphoribosylpyrophosphate amidotransferase
MCGIVGILGREPVAGSLVDALKRLEYRGYDSAGVATLEEGNSPAAAPRANCAISKQGPEAGAGERRYDACARAAAHAPRAATPPHRREG